MLSCIFCVCQVALSGPTQNRKLKAVEPSAGRHWSLLSRSAGPALLHQPSGNPAIPAQPSPVARGWPQTLKGGGILVPARSMDGQTKKRGKGHPHLTASTSPHGRSKIPGRLVCRLGAFFQGASVSRQKFYYWARKREPKLGEISLYYSTHLYNLHIFMS